MHRTEDEQEDALTEEVVGALPTERYADFHTIDWQRDLARDRLRHKFISKRSRTSFFGVLSSFWDAGSGWICVLLVGLTAGKDPERKIRMGEERRCCRHGRRHDRYRREMDDGSEGRRVRGPIL